MRLLATYSLIPTRLALLIQRLYFIIGGGGHMDLRCPHAPTIPSVGLDCSPRILPNSQICHLRIPSFPRIRLPIASPRWQVPVRDRHYYYQRIVPLPTWLRVVSRMIFNDATAFAPNSTFGQLQRSFTLPDDYLDPKPVKLGPSWLYEIKYELGYRPHFPQQFLGI